MNASPTITQMLHMAERAIICINPTTLTVTPAATAGSDLVNESRAAGTVGQFYAGAQRRYARSRHTDGECSVQSGRGRTRVPWWH